MMFDFHHIYPWYTIIMFLIFYIIFLVYDKKQMGQTHTYKFELTLLVTEMSLYCCFAPCSSSGGSYPCSGIFYIGGRKGKNGSFIIWGLLISLYVQVEYGKYYSLFMTNCTRRYRIAGSESDWSLITLSRLVVKVYAIF